MSVFDDFNYRGNPHLKKSGMPIEWSPEMLDEWFKCKDDVIYFAAKYMKIVHIERGIVPFEMYDYQKEMTKSMVENRFSIFGCARQSGKSTAVCAFVLHYLIFNSDKTIAILANKAATAIEILGRVKKAYELLPQWLQHGILSWNKASIELENGSRVLAASTSSDSIRGFSINALLIDEAAFIENWEEFYTSTFPTITSGISTKVILVSTPHGLNHFYKFWADANKEKTDPAWNGFNPIKVTWNQVPGRDLDWYRQALGAMNNDIEKFNQEYNVEFLGSSGTLISGAALKALAHKIPIHDHDGLTQYYQPVAGHIYSIICDVSRGKGLDYSAFSVIDITEMPYQQVCTFRSNLVPPVEYSEIIHRIARHYNMASVLIEINDIGEQVSHTLYNDYEYENVLFTESHGRSGIQITFKTSASMGIRTTKTVKNVGCSMLKLLIEQQQLIINDFNTIQELSTFSRKGNSYEAEPGCNDDVVMGLVLFGWLSSQNYFKEMTDINTIQRLREKTEEDLEKDMVSFGYSDGMLEEVDSIMNISDFDKFLMN